MQTPLLALPLGAAIVLIVIGRVRHGARWGNWVALAGYALVALTVVLWLVVRS